MIYDLDAMKMFPICSYPAAENLRREAEPVGSVQARPPVRLWLAGGEQEASLLLICVSAGRGVPGW